MFVLKLSCIQRLSYKQNDLTCRQSMKLNQGVVRTHTDPIDGILSKIEMHYFVLSKFAKKLAYLQNMSHHNQTMMHRNNIKKAKICRKVIVLADKT